MPIGFGALASLGLALPTGMAFGYGYGYGVRQGYHAFKPSKSDVTKQLHLSPNPVTGATGAGLLSAEHMHQNRAGLQQPENFSAQQGVPETAVSLPTSPAKPVERIQHPNFNTSISKAQKRQMTYRQWKHWLKTGQITKRTIGEHFSKFGKTTFFGLR